MRAPMALAPTQAPRPTIIRALGPRPSVPPVHGPPPQLWAVGLHPLTQGWGLAEQGLVGQDQGWAKAGTRPRAGAGHWAGQGQAGLAGSGLGLLDGLTTQQLQCEGVLDQLT